MRILIIGNRAIQHALAVRLENEGCIVHVYPGQNNPYYTSVTYNEVINHKYDIAIVGSPRYFEHPILTQLKSKGVSIFGPDENAILLETSKAHFKKFASEAGIKTPAAELFSDINLATNFLKGLPGPYVIKANGPARGCGVTICDTIDEARDDLERKLLDQNSPYYSGEVLIEEFIGGFEVAVNIFLDGKDFYVLPPTKPHKRRFDGDKGPMVAGMGSIATLPLNENFFKELETAIIKPTMVSMNEKGWEFRGCLFVNLMLNSTGMYVLEYNCRMGDPAMLVDLMLIRSKLSSLIEATVLQKLLDYKPDISKEYSCAVTLCCDNYPDDQIFDQELDISNLPILRAGMNSGIVIAGAETTKDPKNAKITNGVVFSALATGRSPDLARKKAYRLAGLIPSLATRSDVGTSLLIPKKWAA